MIELKHFKLGEFNCRCCGENKMDEHFLYMLDDAREYSGIPFIITSGYRCPKHNKEVGSTSNNHTKGVAADIRCNNSANRFIIIKALVQTGFSRIGIYPNFIHVDSNNKPNAIWIY
jgi:uncharacterized protein YcbK (DUF882 family)